MSDITFQITYFMKWVIFSGVTFRKDVFFILPNFEEDAHFWFCSFGKNTYFFNPTFKEQAGFLQTVFEGKADFSNAIYRKGAFFSDATFNGDAKFFEVTFSEVADFSRTTFSEEVDFTSIAFKDIRISWKQLKGHFICNIPTTYELMKYFEEKRMLSDADGFYLFLKNKERIEKPWYIRYPEYWIFELTCGYATKPLHVLLVSALVVALFTIPYYIIAIEEQNWILPQRGIKRHLMKLYNCVYFSINAFIIGTPLNWKIAGAVSCKKHYIFRLLSAIERIFGWILLVLLIITLTRTFIR